MDFEKTAATIESFIREKTKGFSGGVIGISGGLDSAVVAHLAVDALGKDKVYGLIMPYGIKSLNDSFNVVQTLGIGYRVFDIYSLIRDFKIIRYFDEKLPKGNLMARIRMCLLYGAANSKNMLVLGTSNRSELAIGYFTKHGDGGVDIEPIGDLYKTEVWKLARYLGINKKIIDKKPSAELWDGQTDEDELGIDYSTLDRALKGEKVDDATMEKVKGLVEKTKHKREMPPVAKVKLNGKNAPPSVTVDVIIDYKEKGIVLIKRKNEPFKDFWALPGGFLDAGQETVEIAAMREAKEETSLDIKIEDLILLGVYSKPRRDPRGPTVSVVYSVKINKGALKGADDALEAKAFKKLPKQLAFDHRKILEDYYHR